MFQAAVTRRPAAQRMLPEIGPNASVLMREHHDLLAVVGHMAGHGRVGRHHFAPEVLVLPLDREIAVRIPCPLVEGWWWILPQPSDEKLSDLVVVNGVRIRRISEEYV